MVVMGEETSTRPYPVYLGRFVSYLVTATTPLPYGLSVS